MAPLNPVTRADFARRIQAALKALGVAQDFEWDELDNRLTQPDGPSFPLEEHFLEVQTQPVAQLDALVGAYAYMYVHPPRQPETWAEAKERVFPWVRPMAFHAYRGYQIQTGEKVDNVPYGALTPHVTVCAATPSKMKTLVVTVPDLERWGVSFEAVLEQARENIAQRGMLPWLASPEFPGMYRSPWKDEFGIGRMVFRDIYASLGLKGDPVVIAPSWQSFFVAGSDDIQGLTSLAKFAVPIAQREPFLILRPLRARGDAFEHWLPPEGHPAREPLHLLHLLNEVGDYGAQARTGRLFLERQEQASNIPVPAICGVRGAPGLHTMATWLEGPPCALPEVGFVLLKRKYSTIGYVSFDALKRVLGPALAPMNMYPQRWLGRAFPTEEQLAAMDLVPWDPTSPPM